MFFKTREKDESLKPVLTVGTVVLAACVLVCSYFIVDIG